MITYDVRSNVDELIKDFGTLQLKQAPWAVKWAANATVVDAADKVTLKMTNTFNAGPRGMRWIHRHVKAMNVGSRLAREYGGQGGAALGIIPPGGAKMAAWARYRGSLVAMMERGGPTPGPRRFGGAMGGSGPMSDLGRYPVPIRRPGHPEPYPRSMYPVNLGLSARTGISTRVVGGGLRGKRRTYLIPMRNNPGHSMIFQRFGKERDATMPIFWVQRETRVPARPFFFDTAQRSMAQRFPIHFEHAMQQALFGRGAYRG
jgi:hypothetical protein